MGKLPMRRTLLTARRRGFCFTNSATSGSVITASYGAASALDIVSGNTPSFSWFAKLNPSPSTTAVLLGKLVSGAWDINWTTTGSLFLDQFSGTTTGVASCVLFDNLWHHYAIAYDGAHARFYRDRAQIGATQTYTSPWTSAASGALGIGGKSNLNVQGAVDDVMVWQNYTLTQADINALSRHIPPAAAPAAWWKFDEGYGTTVADSSGNGFTGTIVNGAFSADIPA